MVRAMGPLTVCVLSIAISNIWNLKAAPASIRVVGSIPKVRFSFLSSGKLDPQHGGPGRSSGWGVPLYVAMHAGAYSRQCHRRAWCAARLMHPLGLCPVSVRHIAPCSQDLILSRVPSIGSSCAGHVQGLPKASTGWFFPMDMFGEKFKLAVVVCIIDVLESISIAKALAYKNRYYLKYGP